MVAMRRCWRNDNGNITALTYRYMTKKPLCLYVDDVHTTDIHVSRYVAYVAFSLVGIRLNCNDALWTLALVNVFSWVVYRVTRAPLQMYSPLTK